MAGGFVRPAIVYVPHKGEEKMVGKVIPHEGGLVFLHCLSGSQYHFNLRCPAPLDVNVTRALVGSGIETFFAYERGNDIMWTIAVERIAAAPIDDAGDRTRYYPPEEWWVGPERGVVEKKGKKGARLYVADKGKGRTVLLAPFLPEMFKVVLPKS